LSKAPFKALVKTHCTQCDSVIGWHYLEQNQPERISLCDKCVNSRESDMCFVCGFSCRHTIDTSLEELTDMCVIAREENRMLSDEFYNIGNKPIAAESQSEAEPEQDIEPESEFEPNGLPEDLPKITRSTHCSRKQKNIILKSMYLKAGYTKEQTIHLMAVLRHRLSKYNSVRPTVNNPLIIPNNFLQVYKFIGLHAATQYEILTRIR
jgi:hypothetical protein